MKTNLRCIPFLQQVAPHLLLFVTIVNFSSTQFKTGKVQMTKPYHQAGNYQWRYFAIDICMTGSWSTTSLIHFSSKHTSLSGQSRKSNAETGVTGNESEILTYPVFLRKKKSKSVRSLLCYCKPRHYDHVCFSTVVLLMWGTGDINSMLILHLDVGTWELSLTK